MIKSLSIVFPIFNEEKRIYKSLKKIENFVKNNFFKQIEIIFVNDGSFDSTNFLIKKFLIKSKFKSKFKYINLNKNFGKGYALKKGIELSKNDWILTSDIDLSVTLNQLLVWQKKYLKPNINVFFGSRLHKDSNVKKNLIRNFFGIIFKLLIFFLFNLKILDTQCGFKLYKKKTAKLIFKNLVEFGFNHDVEIAYRCNKLGIRIQELPVNWQHVAYGKVNILIHPIKMLFNLFKLRIYFR